MEPKLPPKIDFYFEEQMMLHARELENTYAASYEYYYYTLGRDSTLAEQYAFEDVFILFVCNVETNGVWDLKNTQFYKGKQFIFHNKIYSAEDLGNIHFGYVGSLLFPKGILHLGAGIYQIYSGARIKDWYTYFDSPRDYDMVEYGYKLYLEDNR